MVSISNCGSIIFFFNLGIHSIFSKIFRFYIPFQNPQKFSLRTDI